MNRRRMVILVFAGLLGGCNPHSYDPELSSKLTGATFLKANPPVEIRVYKSGTGAFLPFATIQKMLPSLVLSRSDIASWGDLYQVGYTPLGSDPPREPEETDFYHVIFIYNEGTRAYHVIASPRDSRLAYIHPFDFSDSVSGNTEISRWLRERIEKK